MHLVGVLALNLLFLLAGGGILWGVRGWETWRDAAALSGVAYVCGVSGVTVLATLVAIYGGRVSAPEILALVAGVGVVGAVVGWRKGRPLPRRAEPLTLPGTTQGIVALVLAVMTAVLLALSFQAARLVPLTSWDAWAFWMPKAKAIYFFGGLDPALFHSLAGQSYPLFVPTLAAMDFHFMTSADTTTLAAQWCLLAIGFVGGVAGLLRRIAPPAMTWLFLATFAALPEMDRRVLERTADWPLDIFFGLAACALLAWIVSEETWLLAVLGIALAAVMITKREGQLLALCIVVAGVVAAGAGHRRAWVATAGTAMLAYVPAIPWWLWWTSHGLPSDNPGGGFLNATFSHINQAPASFHLVARLLFDYHMWLAATPIALVAGVACLGLPDRRPAVFFLVAFGLGFLGWAWENWANWPIVPITTNPGLNPTNRTVGSLVVLAIVCAPVLIGRLLSERIPKPESVPTPAVS